MELNGVALAIRGLEKRYDDGTRALEALDLEVPAGTFFGLLGPNGAGKTTLINAVCNLIRVSGGEIRVFGHQVDSLEARRMIGVAEQDPNLDRFLTVREALVYHGGYFGLGRRRAIERAEEMIDVFDLREKAGVRAPKLSGGQRRRLLLARALLHEPRLVILDEPTANLSVMATERLLETMLELKKHGVAQIIISHRLIDIFAVGDRVMVLKRGENVGDRYVKNTNEHEVLEIIVSGTRETALSADQALARAA